MPFSTGFKTGYSIVANIQRDREDRRQKAEARNIQLQQAGYTYEDGQLGITPGSAADLQQQKIDQAIQLAKGTQNKLLAADSDRALMDLAQYGNADSLERVRKKNPALAQTLEKRGIRMLGNLDFVNDGSILTAAGVPKELYDTEDKQKILRKNLFKTYDGDRWQVGSLEQAVQETGALSRLGISGEKLVSANMKELQDLVKSTYAQAQVRQDIITGDQARQVQATKGLEPGVAAAEAGRQQTETSVKVDQLAINRYRAETERYKARLMESGPTKKQKDLNRSLSLIDELVTAFGGEEKFLATDFADQKEYLKAYKYITQIEQLEGSELSETERKEVRNISQLISLGDAVQELSPEQTGLFDSKFHEVKKKFSSSLSGVAASAAYNSFRNMVRHTLFGAALTEKEITSFEEAFGTLGNKIGPVLQQFKTSLLQVKGKLDAIVRMNNPYTTRVRLGISQDKLGQIMKGIDQRMKYFAGLEQKLGSAKSPTAPEADKIFKSLN